MILDTEKDEFQVTLSLDDVFEIIRGYGISEKGRQHVIAVFGEWYHDTWLEKHPIQNQQYKDQIEEEPCKGWKKRCSDCNMCSEVGRLTYNGRGAQRCESCYEKRINHKMRWLDEHITMTPKDYDYYHPDY